MALNSTPTLNAGTALVAVTRRARKATGDLFEEAGYGG